MTKPAENLEFHPESLDRLPRDYSRTHHFHRDFPLRRLLQTLVDAAHTAFGDERYDGHSANIAAQKRILPRFSRLDSHGIR